MSSILVTGGFGFVGEYLIKHLLQEGHNITSVSRKQENSNNPNLKIISLDLSNYNPEIVCLAKQFDIIIHLASLSNINESIKNPKSTFFNNTISTLNLLEDIRLNNPQCLFVFFSSEKVYGNAEGESDEEKLAFPMDVYGCSKITSEFLIKSYQINYHQNYIIIRPGNIFGPGQKPGSFIPSVINKILTSPDNVTIGNLEIYRNFIYMEDLITAVMSSLKIKEALNQTFNLCSYNIKMTEVLEEIIKIANGYGININFTQDKNLFRPAETKIIQFIPDCRKAKNILFWKPQYCFEEALKKTFDSYLNLKI